MIEFNDDFFVKLKTVEDILIPHKSFVKAVSRIERAVEFSKRGAEPRHTLLVGESGTGKTWVAEHIQSLHPRTQSEHRLSMPVLLVDTPAPPSLKGLAEAILIGLHDPLAHRGTASDKRNRALGMLTACQVELIVFDEFQHFLDHGKYDSLISVSDWLKRFIDDANVPCVLMGLPRCEGILQINEQLRRRFSSRLVLPAFSIDTDEDELEFRAILNEIDKSLPTDQPSGLAEVDLARRLHFASNGLLGYLRTLITGAFEQMGATNRANLSIDILEDAFVEKIWKDGHRELNPFNRKFLYRRLDRLGEPFSPAIHAVKAQNKKVVI
jgi:hypothetical protein